ncbi:MAG: Na-translocating system protein MpsC family protein, partial [Cyanobacteria bacterium J06555_3]
MAHNLLTCGQLERNLSQSIQAFYRQHLGHQPSKVTCQFFDSKLAIIIEDSITPTSAIFSINSFNSGWIASSRFER